MSINRSWGQIDFLLLALVGALALLGVLGVYSAGLSSGGRFYSGQLLRIGLGFAVCLFVMLFDYRKLVERAFVLYILALLVLAGVLIFGSEVNGSKSWIHVGGLTFQPSEFTKIVVLLAVIRLISDSREEYLTHRRLMNVGVVCLIPILLIILQRDLGTAIMFVPVVGGILLAAGVRRRLLIGVLVVGLVSTPLVWLGLKDYQRQRVLVTLDPGRDPLGIGYQTRQAQIAIGSGGLLGRGIGEGRQSQLGFVPESHTDFIFALLAEETGFLGAASILLLYFLLLSRLITIGVEAKDRAGMLIIAGVVAFIFSHVLINVGMALGIVPPIGIPLPFLSYGGSSTLTAFAAIGLALSVSLRRYMYS
ncbi:MAG: rod shape-determining protein RodA [Acidobacteriota bacterium]